MKGSIDIILFSLGFSAYAMDQLPDKLVNRANQNNDDDLSEDLDDTVIAKNAGWGGVQKAPKGREKELVFQETDSKAAYKNGVMGPNRVWGGFKESEKIADKIGIDTPWRANPIEAFFQEANSKLVDPDLALGEVGQFGDKSKFYKKGSFENPLETAFDLLPEDVKDKAKLVAPLIPGATRPIGTKPIGTKTVGGTRPIGGGTRPIGGTKPIRQGGTFSIPGFGKQGGTQKVQALPGATASVHGPGAQVPWNRGPLPRLSETYADTTSALAVVVIGLLTGSAVAFAFQRKRSRTVILQ